eukprot:XP_011660506.1 PREDICTED: mucin-5AC-like [Strongylocentrotus purpuratus]
MSSHTLPPEGGGGKGPASQTSSSQPPKQQQQQTLTQKLVAEKKPQEKAKVIVQPVHPPLSTTLPLLRQNDSPTPVQQPTPAIIETTVPVIKSSIPNLKQQTVPILSGVASTKPALIPTIPISYTTTTSTAPTTTPITHPHSTSSATPNAPAVVTTQARLAYPPLNVTMTSVVPTRITTTVAAASGATAAAAASAAGGVPVSGVQAQYIPSVQKLPPNSLPAEVPGHTKAGLVPASHLVAGANMLAGQVPYISGSPLGLQLPPGTHPYSTQLPRGPTSTNLSLAATGKSGLTTALLTRAGVPQGAVSTAAFPQQSIYGYSRHHAPGSGPSLNATTGRGHQLPQASSDPYYSHLLHHNHLHRPYHYPHHTPIVSSATPNPAVVTPRPSSVPASKAHMTSCSTKDHYKPLLRHQARLQQQQHQAAGGVPVSGVKPSTSPLCKSYHPTRYLLKYRCIPKQAWSRAHTGSGG